MLPPAAPCFEGPYQVAIGLCEDYPRGTDPGAFEQDFALLAAMGLDTLRISVAWSDYEPQKGVYDWTYLDRLLEAAVDRHGLSLLAYICYAPSWATGGPWKAPPREVGDFAAFAGALAARYRGRIACWELWNEQDNQDFWLGSAADYARLAKAGAAAIKAADPSARICLGGLANIHRQDHLEELFALGIGDHVDVINLHGYFETWNGLPLDNLPACVERCAEVIRSHGGKQQLWVEEIGYSNYVQADGQVSAWYRAKHSFEHTPAYQAVYLIKALALLLATRTVGAIGWYEVKDLPLAQPAIGDVNNHFLGVLDAFRRPKPALFALGLMRELFAGRFEPVTPARLGSSRPAGADVEELLFAMEDGSLTYLAYPTGGSGAELTLVPPAGMRAAAFTPLGGKRPLPQEKGIRLRLRPDEIALCRFHPGSLPALLNLTPDEGGREKKGRAVPSFRLANDGGATAENCRVDLIWPGGIEEVAGIPRLEAGGSSRLELALPPGWAEPGPDDPPGAYLVARCRGGILAALPLGLERRHDN